MRVGMNLMVVGVIFFCFMATLFGAQAVSGLVLTQPATVMIHPETLNLESEGKWITCLITVPEGFNVGDINVSTIILNGTVPAQPQPVSVGDGHLMVKFDRNMTETLILSQDIESGNVTLTVDFKLNDGTMFEGSDTIRVNMPGDVDGDLKVDVGDLVVVLDSFGSREGSAHWNPMADQNGEGRVDIGDVGVVTQNFGNKYP